LSGWEEEVLSLLYIREILSFFLSPSSFPVPCSMFVGFLV
jgi:hypothetical protein